MELKANKTSKVDFTVFIKNPYSPEVTRPVDRLGELNLFLVQERAAECARASAGINCVIGFFVFLVVTVFLAVSASTLVFLFALFSTLSLACVTAMFFATLTAFIVDRISYVFVEWTVLFTAHIH